MTPRTRAILQAFFVTFLWSTSWPLIKIGLVDIPPLTFAGARYVLAAGVLWVATARRSWPAQPQASGAGKTYVGVGMLLLLGLLGFAIPQAAQFFGLVYLDATDVSLLMNFIAVVTVLVSAVMIRESPSLAQGAGIVVALGGALGYFYPFGFEASELLGVLANLGGVLAVSVHTVIMRNLMRERRVSALRLTRDMMTIGSVVLLGVGLLLEDAPTLTLRSVGIVVFLAAVNTAFPFALWNHTLRELTAPEQAVIGNSMLIQIAILVWITLGERPTAIQIVFLVVVAIATAWVQLTGRAGRAAASAEGAS